MKNLRRTALLLIMGSALLGGLPNKVEATDTATKKWTKKLSSFVLAMVTNVELM